MVSNVSAKKVAERQAWPTTRRQRRENVLVKKGLSIGSYKSAAITGARDDRVPFRMVAQIKRDS